MKRKLLSILLAISMACSMLPCAALAAEPGTETDSIAGTEPIPETEPTPGAEPEEETEPQTLTAEQYAAMVAGMEGTPELLTDEDVFAAAPWLNNTNSGLGIAAIGDGELHPGTYFQTEDNENNAGTGNPDNDLDTYLFRRNTEHPIEVNVTIPAGELPTQSCYVAVRTYDVNSSGQMYPETAEYDVLYVNGTPVGVLTGLDYDWNTSFYQVPVDCLREGENTIQVVMYNCPDIDHFSSIGYTDAEIEAALNDGRLDTRPNWGVNIDWVQLVCDGGSREGVEEFSLTIQGIRKSGGDLLVDVSTVIQPASSYTGTFTTEYSLVHEGGQMAASYQGSGVTGNESFTLQMPEDAPAGTYRLIGLLKDEVGNILASDEAEVDYDGAGNLTFGPKVTHTLSETGLTNRDVTITVSCELSDDSITDVQFTEGSTKMATTNGTYTFPYTYRRNGETFTGEYTATVTNIDKTPPEVTCGEITVLEETSEEDVEGALTAALSASDANGIDRIEWANTENIAATPGDKSATVTVTDMAGNTATETAAIHVTPLPLSISAPTANRQGTTNTFDLSATLEHTGGNTITAWGFVWGSMQYPTLTINNGMTENDSSLSKGDSLTANTGEISLGINYYARAYVTTSGGQTYYSTQTNFGIGAPDYGEFSVEYTSTSNNISTFTISRGADATAGAQTVYYRTVSGSAVSGTHFDGTSGSVTIPDGQTSATVTIREYGANTAYGDSAATAYSNAGRVYFFEIYRVTGGATIPGGTDQAARTMTGATSINRNVYEKKTKGYSIDTNNNYVVDRNNRPEDNRGCNDGDIYFITDRDYNNGNNKHNWHAENSISNTFSTDEAAYLKGTAQSYRYSFDLTATEETDGWEHVWVSNQEPLTVTGENKTPSTKYTEHAIDVNDPTLGNALFTANFEIRSDNAQFSFPSGTASGGSSSVKERKYGMGQITNADYISLDIADTVYTYFSASGNNSDVWRVDAFTDYIQVVDTIGPQLLAVAPLDGTYQAGDAVTVALIFDEIVDKTNSSGIESTSITTSWGTFYYEGGADTNVLYFTGTIENPTNNTLEVTSIVNAASIQDMAGNSAGTTSNTTDETLDTTSVTVSIAAQDVPEDNSQLSATVTVGGEEAPDTFQFAWTTDTTMPTIWETATVQTGGNSLTYRPTAGGPYYLHVLAVNSDGASAYRMETFELHTSGGGEPTVPSFEPPTITAEVDTTGGNWVQSRDITVKWSQADATVTYTGPGNVSGTLTGGTGTVSATANGVYTFTMTVDGVPYTASVTVSGIDRTNPDVTLTPPGEPEETGAVYYALTFRADVSDGDSGVAAVRYQFTTSEDAPAADDSDWQSTTGFEDGSLDLEYTANQTKQTQIYLHVLVTDGAGNTTTESSGPYTVIKEPTTGELPQITLTGAPTSWTKGPVDLKWEVTQPESGFTVTLEGSETPSTESTGTLQAARNGVYRVQVTDNNGATATASCVVNYIDAEAPLLTDSSVSPTDWAMEKTVTLTVSDQRTPLFTDTGLSNGYGGSGVSSVQWKQGESGTYTAATPEENGSYTFTAAASGDYTVKVTDAVGNAAEYTVTVTGVETTPPTMSITGIQSGWQNTAQTITLTVSDTGGSGVAKVEYALVESESQPETAPGNLTELPLTNNSGTVTVGQNENGTWYLYYKVTDNAGNTKDGWAGPIKVDTQAPSLSVTDGTTGAASLSLTVSATFGPAGGTVTVSKDGGAATTVTGGSYTVAEAGTYTFTATSSAGTTPQTDSEKVTVHSITFNGNGGSAVNSQLVVNNGTATEPDDPTRAGYTFGGWQSDGSAYSFDTPVTGDVSLTAVWTLDEPTVNVTADQTTATYHGGETVITLTATTGHDADVTYTYQWYKGSAAVSGATGQTLELSTVADTGSYYVVVTATAGTQTSEKQSNTVDVKIVKAMPTLNVSAGGITYGDTLAGSELYGTASLGEKQVEGEFTWDDSSIMPAAADSGTTRYTVVFTPTDTDNYNTATTTITLTVNKRTLIPSVASVEGKTYDGYAGTTGTISLSGAVNNEQPTATGTFTFTDTSAGEDKVVNVTNITLGEGWDANYVLSTTELTTTADITPKTVSLTWNGHENLTYDGQAKNVSATVVAGNLIGDDTCTVTVEGGTETAAGTYTAKATGLSNANYALPTDVTQEYTIAKRPVTLSVDEDTLSYTYSNTAYTADVTVTGGVEADGAIFSVSYRADSYDEDSATDAGSYDVWVELTNDNYKFDGRADDVNELDTGKDLVIAPKSITGTWTDLRQVYGDGKTVGIRLNGLAAGDENVKATITGPNGEAVDALTAVGTYALTAAVNSNYTLTNGTATLVIEKRPVHFTVSDNAVTPGDEPTITTDPAGIEGEYTITYRDEDGNEFDTLPEEPGEYEIWVEFDADSSYQPAGGGTEQPIGTVTVSPQPPALYRVSFDGNGADTAPADLEVAGGSQLTLPAALARAGYRFTGWSDGGSVLYQPGDQYTVPYRNVTLTAQWQAVFNASGTVREEVVGGGEPVALANAVVELWCGSELLAQAITDEEGNYSFGNLIPGTYNLVVSKDVRTVTSKVVIVSADAISNATLPAYATNSVVEVAPGSPAVVVGGLDTAFQTTDETVYTEADQLLVEEQGGRVELTFTAEEKQETEVAADLAAIREAFSAGTEDVLVMDYQLEKTVFEPGEEPVTTNITQSNVLLEVILPLPGQLQGKYAYRVYRVHEDQAQQLTQTPNELGEYFTVDGEGATLTLRVKCFSTYAVGYEDAPARPTYPSTVTQPEHGAVTVSPQRPTRGQTVTITAEPDEGYVVDEVVVLDRNGNEVEVTQKGDGTYTFTQPSGSVTVTVTFTPAEESLPFTDVEEGAWYYDAVEYVYQNGLMSGVAADRFAPDLPLNRATMVTILWRLAGEPAVDYAMPFGDVAEDTWYTEAVRWGASTGVVTGTTPTTYRPEQAVTREQMAAMLHRYAEYMGYDTAASTDLDTFPDAASVNDYASAPLAWCVAEGFISGIGAELRPQSGATRAQIATLLMRFCKTIAE